MTNEMYKELCAVLKHRNRIMLIVLIALFLCVVGLAVLSICQFEMDYTDTDVYDVEYDANTETGDISGDSANSNSSITQIFSRDEKTLSNIAIIMICLTVITFIIAITIIIGVFIYGKNKVESKNESKVYANTAVEDTQERADKHNQEEE